MSGHRGQKAAGVLLLSLVLAVPTGPRRAADPPRPQAVYCFAPGTPQEVIRAYSQSPAAHFFFTANRWSGTAFGSPRTLTWSLIPDGVNVDGKSSQLFSKLDAQFASQGGRQKWISLFEASFNRWSQISGLSYVRIRQGSNDWDDGAAFGSSGSATRGDIRIGMIPQDGAYGVLAYNYYPQNGDMVMDSQENWAQPGFNFRFLRNIVMHEHGHGLGLAHVCPANGTKLMEPMLDTSFDGPQHDDIRAAESLYGDGSEDNNTRETALMIGAIGPGSSLILGEVPSPSIAHGATLSIDADGEEDHFRFTATDVMGLSVTLTPIGLQYDSSTQNGYDGSCNSGNLINSLTLADLNAEVLDSTGQVLATLAAQPAGQPEQLANLFLPATGDYYVRVYESNTPQGPQLYRLTLTFGVVDCNHNGVPDQTDIANGTSRDCNGNGQPDECETALDSDGDLMPDTCEWAHGDFDLDGDTDQSDFGFLQSCLTGLAPLTDPACTKANLDGDLVIDATDVGIFRACLSGAGRPYTWECRTWP